MIIDPLTLTAASSVIGNVAGAVDSVLGSETKPVAKSKIQHPSFEEILSKQKTGAKKGISSDDALTMMGATVTVKNADGSLVTGKVEQVAFADNGGVNLRVQGHDYLNTQVVNAQAA